MSDISKNIALILDKIQSIKQDSNNIKLIAVSKTKPIEMLIEAFEAGQRIFGENKVQEAKNKSQLIPQNIEFHFIGALQKNKAKYCPNLFSTIHSLHDHELALKLNSECIKKNTTLNVLIQMNLSNEKTKNGLININELNQLSEKILALPNLNLIGLMTIPDPTFNETQTAKLYEQLFELRETVANQFRIQNQFVELSMGMSHDYELALQQGATMIRVGSAIFGKRDYPDIPQP